MTTNSQDLQIIADKAKEAEETIEKSKEAGKTLESAEAQIKNAHGVLALLNFEIGEKTKELDKLKKDSTETFKAEKERLVDIQVKRQDSEKEFGDFLVSVKKEKDDIEEARVQHAKDLEKLEDSKRTNQFLIDEKKRYTADAKKEGENLELTRVRAEADINGMKVLEKKLLDADGENKMREQSIRTQQESLDKRNSDLNQREADIHTKEAQLSVRESNQAGEEAKVRAILAVVQEKETLIYKLEEGLKLKGIELPKEAKKEEDGGKTVSWKPEKVEAKVGKAKEPAKKKGAK